MSTFEFVLVSFAIIIGLGISEILAGWGEQIRARHRKDIYPLQLVSSALILLLSMQYLWGLWVTRDIAWTFPLFLLVSVPGLSFALAAHASKVDTSVDAPPVRAQYFSNSRPVYLLLAMFPIVILTLSFVSSARQAVIDPPNLLTVSLIRLLVFALLVSLAWSKSERVHWVGLGGFFLVATGFMIRLVFRLVASDAQ
jgi:hypothetical protein